MGGKEQGFHIRRPGLKPSPSTFWLHDFDQLCNHSHSFHSCNGYFSAPLEDERRPCTGVTKRLVFRMGSLVRPLLLMLCCWYPLGKGTWWTGPGSDSGKQLSAERNAWELHIYIRPPLSTGGALRDPCGCLKPQVVPNAVYTPIPCSYTPMVKFH